MPAAYAWTFSEESVSLSDWVRSQTKSIVVSACDEYEDSIHEINRVLLNLLCKELLAIKDPPARTFLYLDELEHLGQIAPLKRVAEKGADLQINLVLGLHDLDTLMEVYGKQTEGILGLCGFKAFLNIGNRHSKKWASDALGTQRVKLSQTSTQSGSTSGKSTREEDSTNSESSQSGESVTWLDVTRNLAEPDDLKNLPMPMHSASITGYFMAPGHEPYKGTLPLAMLLCNQEE